jgi:hypothetical protein
MFASSMRLSDILHYTYVYYIPVKDNQFLFQKRFHGIVSGLSLFLHRSDVQVFHASRSVAYDIMKGAHRKHPDQLSIFVFVFTGNDSN